MYHFEFILINNGYTLIPIAFQVLIAKSCIYIKEALCYFTCFNWRRSRGFGFDPDNLGVFNQNSPWHQEPVGAETQSIFTVLNKPELYRKSLHSAYHVIAYILLMETRPSEGVIKPGGYLGVFYKRKANAGTGLLLYRFLPHLTFIAHILDHNITNLGIFSYLQIQIIL